MRDDGPKPAFSVRFRGETCTLFFCCKEVNQMYAANLLCVLNKIKLQGGNYERQRHELTDVLKVKVNSFQPLPAPRGVIFS